MELTAGAIRQQFQDVDPATHMALAFLDLGYARTSTVTRPVSGTN